MCPMTPCGARQMSMFSGQLFKAIQSVSPRQGNVKVRLFGDLAESFGSSKKSLLPLLSDVVEVSRPRWGGVLLSVGERTDSLVFSHALLSEETLIYACMPEYPSHI